MSENAAAYARRLGCLFGYPQTDVEHFIATDPPDTQPEELVANGMFPPEEVAYTTYLPYRHDDSIAGYERAIETGQQIKATVLACAEQWKLPALASLTDDLYHNTRSELAQQL